MSVQLADATTLARRADPRTSVAAADLLDRSGARQTQVAMVFDAITAHPGCTADELAQHLPLTRVQVGKRTSDLRNAGTVTQGIQRRCHVTGRAQVTWWPITPSNAPEAHA